MVFMRGRLESRNAPNTSCPAGTQVRANWVIFFLTLALPLWFSTPVRGDMVYGRVYGAEGKFQPRDVFIVKDPSGRTVKEVKTDEYKGYSVFLPAGSYKVEFKDRDKTLWEAAIESYPQPVKQDIRLKKR